MPSPSYRLEPLPGYTRIIGRLVGMLLYARHTTLAAVDGMSIAELDPLHDDASNSIGARVRSAVQDPIRHTGVE